MKHRLKELLPNLGITQKELAIQVGITEVGLSKLINKGTTSEKTIKKIANIIGLKMEDIAVVSITPQAKYEGELRIRDKTLSCAVLDNGMRILTATAIFDAFDRPRKGKSSEIYRADQMPSFINANNLQPFVDEQFKEWTNLVDYTDINGNHKQGYNARILRGLCKIYIEANNAGILVKSQERFVFASQALLYALSDVGIIALVDEATGYEKERQKAKKSLQDFFNTFLVEEAAKWVKTFPDQFFEDIYKMRHWNWQKTTQKPSIVGTWIRNIVYDRLAPILRELDKRNPKNDNGNRKYRHHQFLDPDVGLPRLKQHLEAVHAIAVVSNYNWDLFMANLDRAYPTKNDELFLDFDFN